MAEVYAYAAHLSSPNFGKFRRSLFQLPHSRAKKRYSLTKTGKVKRAMTKKRHLLNGHGKTTKLKRALRGTTYADKTNEAAIKRMILYK